MKKLFSIAVSLLSLIGVLVSSDNVAEACSRILYVGEGGLLIVGRSLDWKTPIPTNLYVYPAGIAKKGHDLPGAVEWTSKYGAVYAVSYDGGVTEGMNERGLSVNGLFCKNAVYSDSTNCNRPPISLAMFVAWLLDMNATTQEVVDVLQKHDFTISGQTFDGGTVSALHWGVTDASGDCAIFEFVNGQLNIYRGEKMKAMTNDPNFPEMTAINNYWETINGVNFLPGTVRSPDRYVRGYFYAGHVDTTSDPDLGVSITRTILMNVSVPYTYLIPGEPNVSSTQWRSFSNLRDKRYYFDFVTNMGMYYVDLKECKLTPGSPILKLDTSHFDAIGDVTKKFKKNEGFKPMY